MMQEWFVYTFIAQERVILAEHTTRSSNIPDIAAQWLDNLPADPHNKFTSTYDNHTFNFLVESGYVYGVVANVSVGRQITFELLERIREEFQRRYGRDKRDAATAKILSKEFGGIMKQQMQYVIDHAEEIDKLAKVRAQISEVQVIIMENIDKLYKRGENLNIVADRARELHESSLEYKQTATEIRRKLWFKSIKIKLVILGILLVLALIIWLSICHGFNCAN